MNSDLMQAIANLSENLGPFWDLFHIIAYILGALMLVGSLLYMRSQGQGHGHSQGIGGAFIGVVCGVALLGLPALLDALSSTIFETSAPTSLSSVSGGSGADGVFIKFAIRVIMLVGLYAVIKGITMLKDHARSQQGGTLWSAMVHLCMGILCINVEVFMRVLAESIGGVFKDITLKLLSA